MNCLPQMDGFKGLIKMWGMRWYRSQANIKFRQSIAISGFNYVTSYRKQLYLSNGGRIVCFAHVWAGFRTKSRVSFAEKTWFSKNVLILSVSHHMFGQVLPERMNANPVSFAKKKIWFCKKMCQFFSAYRFHTCGKCHNYHIILTKLYISLIIQYICNWLIF